MPGLHCVFHSDLCVLGTRESTWNDMSLCHRHNLRTFMCFVQCGQGTGSNVREICKQLQLYSYGLDPHVNL